MTDLCLRRRSSAPTTRPVPFKPLLLVLLIGGCGDAAEPEVTPAEPEVVIEVEAPVSQEGAPIASIDYEIACDPEWRDIDGSGVFVPTTQRSGTLELSETASAPSGDQLPGTRLWNGAEAPLDGLCLLNLVGRDAARASLCAGTATFEATADTSGRVSATLDCLERPAFIGDLFVGATTPEAVGGFEIQTVEYTIICESRGTAFFEGMSNSEASTSLNGNLEVRRDPGRMNVEESFLQLPVGLCGLQLRARNAENGIACAGFERFTIGPERTTTVNMVIDCFL